MACDDVTPWSISEYPHTVNRLRVTGGGSTSQSTGEWVAETTGSLEICGSIGRGTSIGIGARRAEDLMRLAGGQFKTGDQFFICRTDCDVALNDIIEVYDDAAGVTKTYWRVLTKLKELTAFENLRGYGRTYWLVRREER